MNLPRPPAEADRGWRRWLMPVALLALLPKCFLCVLAYAGVGVALGFGGPELCGTVRDPTLPWPGLLVGIGGGMVGGLALIRRAG